MPAEAFNLHGLSQQFLWKFPTFKKQAKEFLEFVGSDTIVAHNAPFDIRFINAELYWAGHPIIPLDRFKDTLVIAREKLPELKSHSLDKVCGVLGINLEKRDKHGAIIDA